MNLQQLRYVRETVRRNFNLTEAARALHTSQPGVSRQIRELEEELGVEIFQRHGKRFLGLTGPGARIVQSVERALEAIEGIQLLGRELSAADSGELSVGATHTQARYTLPEVVRTFRQRYPRVRLSLHQGSPEQLAAGLTRGELDVAIATESLADQPHLLALPAYSWHHGVVIPEDHPLAEVPRLTLEALSRLPLITYDRQFTGRPQIDAAFAQRNLPMDVVLTALDADVVKTYVALGIGVGIVAEQAFDPARDRGLKMLEARHLFPASTTRIAVRRGSFLRAYVYDFVQIFAPSITRASLERSLTGEGDNYEL